MSDVVRETLYELGLATSVTKTKTATRTFLCQVSSGADQGKQIALGARPVSVGADAACDLVLEDPKVSRRHVELRAHPDGISIKDLESRNGTFVDGVRV